QLLTNIRTSNEYYKTINISKFYNQINKNNIYYFIIFSCIDKGYNILCYSFNLSFESNNEHKFNLTNNNICSSLKINLFSSQSLLNGSINHIVFLMHYDYLENDDEFKNFLTIYNLKNN